MSNALTDKPRMTSDTRVSGYDRLSAMLVAGVTMFGVLVFLMFIFWLSRQVNLGMTFLPEPVDDVSGYESRPEGVAFDWQPPGVLEFPEVDKPQIADALESTSDAVSRIRGHVEKFDGDALKMGFGPGLSDMRFPGPGTGEIDVIPEADRWKIELAASTQGEYMNILEHFDITIGVVHELSNLIQYVDNLTAHESAVREDERKNEGRLFFMNQKNRLRKWDQNKAESVGLELKNTLVGHFYPKALKEQMLALELEVCEQAGKSLYEVKKTKFRIRPNGSGYEYVIPPDGIEYRSKQDTLSDK
jgi:hypothetical protein